MRTVLILIFVTMTANAQSKMQSDKHFWNTLEINTNPETIWKIWTDVDNWKQWDSGLKDAMMDEKFRLKARGHIISLEDRKSKFKVVEFVEGKSYTFKTKLPLASLYVKRYLIDNGDTVTITHEVWFKGFLAGIFAKNFGPKFRKMLPEVMNNIKTIVEGKSE